MKTQRPPPVYKIKTTRPPPIKSRENEPSQQTDDVHTSEFVKRNTIAHTIQMTGTLTRVREDRHYPRLTKTTSRLTMTNDHPVPPGLRTDTVQEGTQCPSHTMTNDSPPSPPTSRISRQSMRKAKETSYPHGIHRHKIDGKVLPTTTPSESPIILA